MQDIERMLRDAAADRWDGQVFDRVSLDEAFDKGSLNWYRGRFHQANEGFDPEQPDEDFLREWGYLARSDKEVRNPAIAAAMRRITMCEQAGTGFRMMQREWTALGHPAPVMKNDRARKAFDLFIPGLDKEVDMASDLIKAMFGKTEKAHAAVAGELPEQVTDQVTVQVADQVSEEIRRLLLVVRGEMTGRELQAALNLRGRVNFRQKYLTPALSAGLIAMTIPDKPNSRLQKYRLTEQGHAWLEKG